MSAADADDPYREWDSAYVLGALAVHERLAYERHLETCDACSDAVRDLAGVPGILGRLDAGDALAVHDREAAEGTGGAPLGTPGSLGASGLPGGGGEGEGDASVHGLDEARVLRGLARRERTLRRRRALAFAASCVLFTGLGAGAATLLGAGAGHDDRAGAHAPASVAMKPVGASPLHAAVSVAGKPWGTRLEWSCSYGNGHAWSGSSAPKVAYELVVTDTHGKRTVVATWKAAGSAAKHLAASSKSAPDEIRSVGIRLAGSHQELAERYL